MALSKPVRTIEVNRDERVVLKVSGCDYVRLEFPGMTVGIRYEDGVVYQYQEPRPIVQPQPDDADVDPIVESLMANSGYTERYSIATTPSDVAEYAGHYSEVNNAHADRLAEHVCHVRKLDVDFSPESSVPSCLDYDTDEEPIMPYHYGDTQE